MSNVIAGPALQAAIVGGFMDTYQAAVDRSRQVDQIVRERPIGSRVQRSVIPESVDHMHRWDEGEDIDEDGFRWISFDTTAHKWGLRVPYRESDEEDDQVNELVATAQQVAQTAPILKERVALQILRNQTNPALLPSVPLAADGVGYYSTVNVNGADRFGVSGGNIEPGTGITASAIRTDYLNAVSRILQFQNNKGLPVHNQLSSFMLVYGTHLQPAVWGAFFQERPPTSGGTGNESNLVRDSDVIPALWSSPFLADINDLFVFALDAPRSLISSQRRGLRQFLADMTNSDRARNLGEKYLQVDMRWGMGLSVPFDTAAIDNTASGVGS